MKPSLLFATFSLVLASPQVFAKTELEMLRARCQEQERQIQQLEEDKARLSGSPAEARGVTSKRLETVSAAIATPSRSETYPGPGSSLYKVKSGDSLAKISRSVGTSIDQLAKTNNLKTNAILRPGQELKVPAKPATTSAVAAASPAATKPKAPSQTEAVSGKTHVLKQGETFSSLSKKYKISVQALVEANPSLKPTRLRPGQTVNLSKSAASSAPQPANPVSQPKPPAAIEKPVPRQMAANIPVSAPVPRTETKPAPSQPVAQKQATPAEPKKETTAATAAPEAPAAKTERKAQPMTIDGEITYGEFAAKHGTDTERLNSLNGLDLTKATVLAKGSELYVPAQP